jgi:predicted PolB exonuclease-like 3'-5' exonuclease
MTAYVVYDFEAVLDRDNPLPEGSDPDKVPAVAHLEIVSGAIIGLVLDGSRTRVQVPRLLGTPNYGEMAILRDFNNMVDKHRPVLVSWNGRGFDLPLVVARCVRHGIVAPWLWDRDFEDRYRGGNHLDLQDAVSLRGAGRPSRMAAFACLTGFPGKVGVDGSDVEGLWNGGETGRTAVRDYNLSDVASEAAILLRVLVCRGNITMDEYLSAARALLDHIDADTRLAPLRDLIVRKRFLMEADSPE